MLPEAAAAARLRCTGRATLEPNERNSESYWRNACDGGAEKLAQEVEESHKKKVDKRRRGKKEKAERKRAPFARTRADWATSRLRKKTHECRGANQEKGTPSVTGKV